MAQNPITEQLVLHLQSGKQVGKIHPDPSAQPNKKVTFYFEDGTHSVFPTTCDHNTFMRWWGELDIFIRMARKLQDVDEIQ